MTEVKKPKKRADLKPTISPEFFEIIKLYRRQGDIELLVNTTGLSRPTIDRALNFGFVYDEMLDRALIELYTRRANEYRDAVRNIIEINQTIKP